ncbi:MAG: TPM domain-containing protein [Verrucomicrobiales bacterium]
MQRIHRGAEVCPHCGFSMAEAEEVFGAEEVCLRKFTDSAGVLRSREREPLRMLLERFEDQFPQVFFAIYIGAFQEMPGIRRFGFWMLNRARYMDVGAGRSNEHGILLVMDVNGKEMGLTLGRGLAPFWTERLSFEVLAAGHPYLLQGEYFRALRAIIKKTSHSLKKQSRRALRADFSPAPPPGEEKGGPP